MPAPHLPKIAPCPFCGKDSASIRLLLAGGRLVRCNRFQCDARGPWRTTDRGAILAWNRASRRAR